MSKPVAIPTMPLSIDLDAVSRRDWAKVHHQFRKESRHKKTEKGGPGSGNFGHSGRPGKVGGSAAHGGLSRGEDIPDGPETMGGVPGGLGAGIEGALDKYHAKASDIFKAASQAQRVVETTIGGTWAHPSVDRIPDISATLKNEIAMALAEETGLDYSFCSHALRAWAKSSQSGFMLVFQGEVAKEFGLPVPPYIQRKIDKLQEARERDRVAGYTFPYDPDDIGPSARMKMRKLARGIYNHTQKVLRSMGIGPMDYIDLHRGTNRSTLMNASNQSGPYFRYTGNPIEAWSLSLATAKRFGRRRASMSVAAKNVFCTALSGLGCYNEQEFVIFGSEPGYVASIR